MKGRPAPLTEVKRLSEHRPRPADGPRRRERVRQYSSSLCSPRSVKLTANWTLGLHVAGMGDANAAWLRDRLEARGDIDDFAEDIAARYDDVSDIDADAQEHLVIVGHASVAETDKVLDRQSAIEGGDRRGELQEHRISGGVDGAPAGGLDDRRNRGLDLTEAARYRPFPSRPVKWL